MPDPKQITELPVASSAGDSDLMLLRQSASDKQVSVQNVRAGLLRAENDLDDVDDVATARTNLGVAASADTLLKAGNLSGLASASTSRTNLGLGTAAVANTGTGDTNVLLVGDLRSVASTKLPRSAQLFIANGTFTVPSNIDRIYILCVAGCGGGGGGATNADAGVDGNDGNDSSVTDGMDVLAIAAGGGGGDGGQTSGLGGQGGTFNGNRGGHTSIGAFGGRGGMVPAPAHSFPDQGGGVTTPLVSAGGTGGAGHSGGGGGGGGAAGNVIMTVLDVASGQWTDEWTVACGPGGDGGAAGGGSATAGTDGSDGFVVFFW
jgi:hypothetical protein